MIRMNTKELTCSVNIFDKAVMEFLLQDCFSDETINVLNIRNNSDLSEKSHYFSTFLKLHISYTSRKYDDITMQQIDIAVKLKPNNDFALNMVNEQRMFAYESTMLREILPQIEFIVGEDIGPKLWYCSNIYDVLFMEDLSRQGFVMKNIREGLSMQQCVAVIKKLAKLHAGSVALHHLNSDLMLCYEEGGILSKKCPESYWRLAEVFLANLSKAIKKLYKWRYKRTLNKLDAIVETFRDRCADIYKHEPDEFCVLNHGDVWVNNMLFKEDDEGCQVRLVDYQMLVYASPAIDLHYFLNICPKMSIKYVHDSLLLDVYLETLENTMKKIGCTTAMVPTKKELQMAMYKTRIYAIFSGLVLYLRMTLNDEISEDFIETLDKLKGETKVDIYKNPLLLESACKLLRLMDERLYLD